jgi:hypothetical protein
LKYPASILKPLAEYFPFPYICLNVFAGSWIVAIIVSVINVASPVVSIITFNFLNKKTKGYCYKRIGLFQNFYRIGIKDPFA